MDPPRTTVGLAQKGHKGRRLRGVFFLLHYWLGINKGKACASGAFVGSMKRRARGARPPRSCLRGMLRHAGLWRHGIIALRHLLLLLGHIILIGHGLSLLLFRHVAGLHAAGTSRHCSVLRWKRSVAGFLWRLDDGLALDAILVARSRFRCIKTCLDQGLACNSWYRRLDTHTWIRFLPSGFVTSGCNFGVVNV